MESNEIALNLLSEKSCSNCNFQCLGNNITCENWTKRNSGNITVGTCLPQYSTNGSIFYNTESNKTYIYHSKMWNEIRRQE